MRTALAVLVALSAPAAGAGEPANPRFRIDAVRAVRSTGETTRFAIEARATRLPAPDPDARFTLVASPKATTGTCGPDADALFANGFE